MIKALLGAELFRKGMDLYFDRHDGEAATVEQFVQCFADVSGRDFSQFMLWYTQAGTPEVVVAPHYDARAKTYRLDIKQTVPPTPGQPDKKPMVIPLALGLVGKHGNDLPLTLDCRSAQACRAGADGAEPKLRLHRHCRAADPLGQSRLLGADQADAADQDRRSAFPCGARSRPFQPVAGCADAGNGASDDERRGAADEAARRAPTMGSSRRSARSLPTLRSSRPSSRSRSRRRASPILRARSGTMSIRTRSSRRGSICARPSATRSARRSRQPTGK